MRPAEELTPQLGTDRPLLLQSERQMRSFRAGGASGTFSEYTLSLQYESFYASAFPAPDVPSPLATPADLTYARKSGRGLTGDLQSHGELDLYDSLIECSATMTKMDRVGMVSSRKRCEAHGGPVYGDGR